MYERVRRVTCSTNRPLANKIRTVNSLYVIKVLELECITMDVSNSVILVLSLSRSSLLYSNTFSLSLSVRFCVNNSSIDKTPVWNEVFVFPVVDSQLDQLVIEVKDKNFTSSVLIGDCRLPVNMFLDGSVTDQWYTLNNGSKSAGEINLRVQVKKPTAAPVASSKKTSEHAVAQAYPYPQQASYPKSQQYPASDAYAYPASTSAAVAATSAPQAYPSQQYPPQQYPPQQYPSQQYPSQQYPPQQYPPQQYPSQPYYQQQPPPPYSQYPPPPPAYGYPSMPPANVAYAGGPPATVVAGGPPYGYGSRGGSGFGNGKRGGGVSTGQMAMGVGAGVLGGMLLGEALDDVFD